MKMDDIKQGLSSLWDSVADGWQHVRQSATNSLTDFRPGEQTNLPIRNTVDDTFYMPTLGWSMLGGDLYEDDTRVIVRLEIPGLTKEHLDISVDGDTLVVRGEKQFSREDSEGRYRVIQCAYGNFRRTFPLNVPVLAELAKASYENGVLRVELPKAKVTKPQIHTVKIN